MDAQNTIQIDSGKHRPLRDHTGEVNDRRTVERYHGYRNGKHWWWCKCACGSEWAVQTGNLLGTRSCGCLKHELFQARIVKHGHARVGKKISEYNTWCLIIARCTNPNSPQFANYGGRGIKICEEWRHSFETFLAYVGRRPSPQHSLDRFPNNGGNYEPGNVRWATPKQQCRNKRNNRLITFGDQTMTIEEWSEKLACAPESLKYRLDAGWDVGLALRTPFSKHNRLFPRGRK